MKVDKFIEMLEDQTERGNPIIQEMHFYNENPENLKEGDMIPSFDQMPEEMYFFYIGMVFGVGLANKHDIDQDGL